MAKTSNFDKVFKEITDAAKDEIDGFRYGFEISPPILSSKGIKISSSEIKDVISSKVNLVLSKFTQIVISELTIRIKEAFYQVWPSTSSDIISSGELLDSLNIQITTKGLSITFDAPYASIIHYGGYIVPYGNKNAERVYLAPRPFLDVILGRANGPVSSYDFQDALTRAINSVN